MSTYPTTLDSDHLSEDNKHRQEAGAEYQHSYKNQTERNWSLSLPSLLRGIGSVAILVSLYTFLMKGWEGSSDVFRYLMLLGHTGVLSVIAFASARYFKEGKGPRLLIMLSLISAVANFAILGAFIFSTTVDIGQLKIPEYIVWSMDGFYNSLFLSIASLALLIPIIGFGFRILARGMSKEMTLLFLVSNACLLIPERNPEIIGLMAVALALFTMFFTGQSARSRIEAKTFEGKFVLFLQFLPIVVLLGRSFWLHWFFNTELIFLAAISTSLFIIFRQISLSITPGYLIRGLLEFSSFVLAMMTGLICLVYFMDIGMNEEISFISSAFITSTMCYEISLRTKLMSKVYHTLAIVIFSWSLIVSLMTEGSSVSILANIVTGIIFIVMSYKEQKISLLIAGFILLMISIIKQSIELMQFFDFGYWSILAISGIVAIVLGSALESKGKNILQYLQQRRKAYAEWHY